MKITRSQGKKLHLLLYVRETTARPHKRDLQWKETFS